MQFHSLFPSSSNQALRAYDFENSSHAGKNDFERSILEKVNHRFDDDSFQLTSPADTHSEAVSSNLSLYSFEKSLSKTADLQITTQEGDVVTISFKQLEEISRNTFQAEQGDSKVRAYSEKQSFERDFSLVVEGNLNQDEQKAIHDLINGVSKVSKEFFKGDVNAAFKHALKLGFNSQQISAFSLDLRREESVQAIAAYKQTVLPAQNVDSGLLEQAGRFITEVEDFVADSSAVLESLTNPKKTVFDVFSGFGALYFGEEDDRDEGNGNSLFLDTIENIANQQFG